MTPRDGPAVGVGAVVVDAGRVLLIRRGKEPLFGRWVVPGGTVEKGESLESALVREVCEETNLVVRPGPVLTVFDRIERAEGRVTYHFVIVDYLCTRVSGEVRAGSDALAARFVGPEELEGFELPPKALEVVLQGLALSGVPLPDPLPKAGSAH